MTLEIGDFNRNGLIRVTDTNWDNNGTLFVTVCEMIGGFDGWVGGRTRAIRAMRDTARQALVEYRDGQTKSARLVRTWYDGAQHHATFAVSRNEV